MPVCDLKIKDVEKWRQERMKAGTKAATCNRRLTALKAALNWGVKREYIESNPLAKLEKLQEHDSDVKIRYLTDDERESLMSAIDAREKRLRDGRDSHNNWSEERDYELLPPLSNEYADHMKPMILVSLNTGIRQGNLFSLKWGDIDFETRTFRLRAAVSKSGKTLDLPMNETVYYVLSAWQGQSPNTAPSDLVFPSPVTGETLTNVKKAWMGILKDAGIENFRWHDMRHDFASQLVMRGVDLNTVRELMGHSELKMTLRYAHLAPDNKLRAVELLTAKRQTTRDRPD
jgi:integrase